MGLRRPGCGRLGWAGVELVVDAPGMIAVGAHELDAEQSEKREVEQLSD